MNEEELINKIKAIMSTGVRDIIMSNTKDIDILTEILIKKKLISEKEIKTLSDKTEKKIKKNVVIIRQEKETKKDLSYIG